MPESARKSIPQKIKLIHYRGFYFIDLNFRVFGVFLLIIGFLILLTDFGWAACDSPILFWKWFYNILFG